MSGAVGVPQPARDRVEVPAVGVEIDLGPVGRPVVLRGQEIGQRLQPPVKMRVVPVLGGARDRVAEFLARVVFNGQHAVDVAAETQRADHVVRRPDQVVPAERLEPLVLLTCHPGRLVPVRPESRPVKLADDLGAAELLLIGVDLVAAGQPEGTIRRLRLAHPHEIADDPAEEAVQRVITRDVTDISPVHRKPFPGPRYAALPSPSAFLYSHALTDTEAPDTALIRRSSQTSPADVPAVGNVVRGGLNRMAARFRTQWWTSVSAGGCRALSPQPRRQRRPPPTQSPTSARSGTGSATATASTPTAR